MSDKNPKVDFYFEKPGQWQDEITHLRRIVLDCGLTEELKWGVPSYTFEGRNIVLIHTFKDYCGLLFVKGALLQNHSGLLIQQTKNVQSARQMRFTKSLEVIENEKLIRESIYEAVEVERAGLKVTLKSTEQFAVPEEFQKKLNEVSGLKAAFEALTPGRQRGYLFYFSQAKQAKTRESRIEKYIESILNGKGLED